MRLAVWLLLLVCVRSGALAQHVVPAAAQASAQFDAGAATDAWLATVPVADRAKSDAYFEGSYWLILWDFLAMAAVMIFLLESGLSARMRETAERMTRGFWRQCYVYWLQFASLTAAILFPLTVYEGYFREHQYGLSNQTFASWFKDASIAFALVLFGGGLVAATLLVMIKRLPRTWHLWGTGAAIAFSILGIVIMPVFLMPLFNTYTPLESSPIKERILSLAHANGIPARDVFKADASRQSKRISANVSGLFGTDRITLNDNLLARCSPEGVMTVMGHEMGHYVMHHILNAVLFTTVLTFLMFGVLRLGLNQGAVRWQSRWRLQGAGDMAVLPFTALLLLTMNLLLSPLQNTFTRTQEYEADIFGLDAARQPDGEAEVDLLLGEYRKLDPSPLEEFLFFDHPGGRTRIFAAMRWKGENLCLFDRRLPCSNLPMSLALPAPSGPSHPSEAPLR